jgi:hypothetical protein
MSPDPQQPKPDPKPKPRKGYVGYMFEPRGHRRQGPNSLEVQGVVRWTVRRPDDRSIQPEFMAAWDDRGYKMGLLVMKGQQMETIQYAGFDGRPPVTLEPLPGAIADLEATLGTPPGYQWLAFGAKGRRNYVIVEPPNVVEFEVAIRITPAQAGAQIVPVASRHMDGTFAESYMPGLWVLPAPGA